MRTVDVAQVLPKILKILLQFLNFSSLRNKYFHGLHVELCVCQHSIIRTLVELDNQLIYWLTVWTDSSLQQAGSVVLDRWQQQLHKPLMSSSGNRREKQKNAKGLQSPLRACPHDLMTSHWALSLKGPTSLAFLQHMNFGRASKIQSPTKLMHYQVRRFMIAQVFVFTGTQSISVSSGFQYKLKSSSSHGSPLYLRTRLRILTSSIVD